MMNKIQLVVFDIAGTTVRDKGNVAEAFISAFQESGLTIPEDEVRKVMGFRKIDAVRMLLEKYYPERATPELTETIHTLFGQKMVQFYEQDTELEPLPHALDIFRQLKEQGIRIALNTGFTRVITDAILQRLHWNNGFELIDRVICSDEVPEGRPAPYMIQALIRELGIPSADHVLKIGDTEVDVEEGRNAGCRIVVSVTTGAYTRAQLEPWQPDYIIDDLSQLLPIIEKAGALPANTDNA